jgi:hypothetical protein
LRDPAARHVAGEAHQTLWRALLGLAPATAGLGTIDHVVPFQDSIRVFWALRELQYPTAEQDVADGQEMPVR